MPDAAELLGPRAGDYAAQSIDVTASLGMVSVGMLSLRETFTIRAARLRSDLEAQLGEERLQRCLEVVAGAQGRALSSQQPAGMAGDYTSSVEPALDLEALTAELSGVLDGSGLGSLEQVSYVPLLDELCFLEKQNK
jgi:hypothetical protein